MDGPSTGFAMPACDAMDGSCAGIATSAYGTARVKTAADGPGIAGAVCKWAFQTPVNPSGSPTRSKSPDKAAVKNTPRKTVTALMPPMRYHNQKVHELK